MARWNRVQNGLMRSLHLKTLEGMGRSGVKDGSDSLTTASLVEAYECPEPEPYKTPDASQPVEVLIQGPPTTMLVGGPR